MEFSETDEFLGDEAFLKKRAERGKKAPTASDSKVMSDMQKAFGELLGDPFFLQDGGCLMFPCQATYSEAGIFSRGKKAPKKELYISEKDFVECARADVGPWRYSTCG
ncbi:unnamed protein product [Amoebophrya sp. A25]|nr:unnamed protein product [Amoebophrya sp. A25]|eukprot:GSA25T00019198001.1